MWTHGSSITNLESEANWNLHGRICICRTVVQTRAANKFCYLQSFLSSVHCTAERVVNCQSTLDGTHHSWQSSLLASSVSPVISFKSNPVLLDKAWVRVPVEYQFFILRFRAIFNTLDYFDCVAYSGTNDDANHTILDQPTDSSGEKLYLRPTRRVQVACIRFRTSLVNDHSSLATTYKKV